MKKLLLGLICAVAWAGMASAATYHVTGNYFGLGFGPNINSESPAQQQVSGVFAFDVDMINKSLGYATGNPIYNVVDSHAGFPSAFWGPQVYSASTGGSIAGINGAIETNQFMYFGFSAGQIPGGGDTDRLSVVFDSINSLNFDGSMPSFTTGINRINIGNEGLFGTFRAASITGSATFTLVPDVAAVPLPAGALLLLTGLGGFGIARRRKYVA